MSTADAVRARRRTHAHTTRGEQRAEGAVAVPISPWVAPHAAAASRHPRSRRLTASSLPPPRLSFWSAGPDGA
eukprot:6446169-Prymnesium_polylepis.1